MAQMTEQDVRMQLDRGRLLLSVPELWGATLHSITDTLDVMTRLSAERVGRPPDDPAVRATVGAIFGVLLTAALDWVKTEDADILSSVEQALTSLDNGLLR
jgi:transcriptional regulator MftR-like protein